MSEQTTENFARRHIGPDQAQIQQMLAALGLDSLDELSERAMPSAIRMSGALDLPPALTEQELGARLRELAARNFPGRSLIGLGYHGTVTPAVIRRNVLENPSWYTAYTPYQPEISQGRLEALLNFQTMISELTGLPVAGASLLDEATAVAEAVALARRATRSGQGVIVDAQLLPQSLAVLQTRARPLGIEVVPAQLPLAGPELLATAFAVVVQVPGTDGRVPATDELRALAEQAHAHGALVIAVADPLLLTLTTPPGQWGADIAAGSTQRFGVPLFYGGPHAGYISVRAGLERQLPGRLVGVSVDADGTPALRLALQTREQHIRRERATSNICTAQVLLAVMASMYVVWHGPQGLTAIATGIHRRAGRLAAAFAAAGTPPTHQSFFDTLRIDVPGRAEEYCRRARAAGFHLRLISADAIGLSVGEDLTDAELDTLITALGLDPVEDSWGGLAAQPRQEAFCQQPVFSSHHSETSMMRYLHTLARRDFALDQGMIPLGSCTMKLNAAAELEAVSLPGFADLHPFVPEADARGITGLISELEDWLCRITGYQAVSVQPNAGSQGEFAGLSAIRRYHESRGEQQRDVCLIPSSAHGTNAASAAMAGLRVVVVKAAPDGSIDLADLADKVAQHADRLACAMVTYPSTHGVYEPGITELCELVHRAGGQVYVDGANMNALVGLARPGSFGADVSHLNLHKTFAIPHGGGGPGVGPVAVRAHLAAFLPGHPLDASMAGRPDTISAAPHGSAGILPISYAYIAMMGAEGLRLVSQVAILNANYLAARLTASFPVLFTGPGGLVAHECILDLRELTARTGITVDDVAKRLIDHGFHAPTMSFPVPGTLMVEPTESEDLSELDRFCAAMIAIRAEMEAVAEGRWPAEDNPLHNAPHPLSRVTAQDWTHPYSRAEAGCTAGRSGGLVGGGGPEKYWPPVARIDQAYGDRNLVCNCPPVEAYQD